MTTSEIKALLDETKAAIAAFEPPLGPHALVYRLASAIETLLARQTDSDRRELDLYSAGCEMYETLDKLRSDVLSIIDNFDPTWPEDGLRRIRAILEPEKKP